MRRPLASTALLAALALTTPAALGQAWPAKPLRMIVPQATGSAPDVVARVICERLAQALGRPVIVDNRAGDGSIGAQAAARAAPDGYTWFFAPASVLVISPYVSALVPYSPEDDFEAVAMVGVSPLVIAANPEVNVKSLPDLITLAREAPGRLAYASPGVRTLPGLLGEMIKARAQIDLMQVPYRGAQGVQDTIAGRTHITVQGIPAVAAAVRSGQLRALAVSSPKRLPELKDVPTVSETFPGFEFNGWFAVVAPAGTSRAAIQRVNQEMNSMLLDPQVEQRLRAMGVYTEGTDSPEQVDAFFTRERAFWAKTVRELKIEPEQ